MDPSKHFVYRCLVIGFSLVVGLSLFVVCVTQIESSSVVVLFQILFSLGVVILIIQCCLIKDDKYQSQSTQLGSVSSSQSHHKFCNCNDPCDFSRGITIVMGLLSALSVSVVTLWVGLFTSDGSNLSVDTNFVTFTAEGMLLFLLMITCVYSVMQYYSLFKKHTSLFCILFFNKIMITFWMVFSIFIAILYPYCILLFIATVVCCIITIKLAYFEEDGTLTSSVDSNSLSVVSKEEPLLTSHHRDHDHVGTSSDEMGQTVAMTLIVNDSNLSSEDLNENDDGTYTSGGGINIFNKSNKTSISYSQSKSQIKAKIKGTADMSMEYLDKNCLQRYNLNFQTFTVVVNATLSIFVTIILIIYNDRNQDDKNRSCFGNKSTAECQAFFISIAIGVVILFVVFSGRGCVDKCARCLCCDCFTACCCCCKRQDNNNININSGATNKNKNNNNNSNKKLSFYLAWSMKDEHLRGIIVLKFGYFMLKPVLIAEVNSDEGHTSSAVARVSSLMLQIILFITTCVLAYVTFNKKYQLLNSKLVAIVFNSRLFGQTYVVLYGCTVVALFSIYVFVIMFAWNNNEMKNFKWYTVIYPQCMWLLFIKLYHNEVSHLVQLLAKRDTFDNDDAYEYEKSDSSSRSPNLYAIDRGAGSFKQENRYLRRLFLIQLSVWLSSVYCSVMYLYLIANTDEHVHVENSSWDVVWYWQVLISIAVAVVTPIATYSSLHRDLYTILQQ